MTTRVITCRLCFSRPKTLLTIIMTPKEEDIDIFIPKTLVHQRPLIETTIH